MRGISTVLDVQEDTQWTVSAKLWNIRGESRDVSDRQKPVDQLWRGAERLRMIWVVAWANRIKSGRYGI
jgi:hypothetical protein